MIGENLVIISGAVGADVDYKPLNNGAVANISIGLNDSYKDKQTGQWVDKTQWQRVVAYGNWAEYAKKHLKKGSKVYVRGRLNNRSWVDQQTGQKRFATEVVAEKLEWLDWPKKEGQQGGYQQHGQQQGGYQGSQQGGYQQQGYQQGQGQPQQPAQPQQGGNNSSYQFQQPQQAPQQPAQPPAQQQGYGDDQGVQPQAPASQGTNFSQTGGAEIPDEIDSDIPF